MAKKVRILTAVSIVGVLYQCNDVVNLPDDLAKAAIADGSADGNKAAVEYALSINGNKIHDPVADAEAKAAAEAAAQQRAILDATIADLEASLAQAKDADKPAIEKQLAEARDQRAALETAGQ